MPNEKKEKAPMPQIVIGGIVSTSLAKPTSKEYQLVPYVVRDGQAKVGDLYSVIADSKLAYLRVTKVVDFYEFLPWKIDFTGDLQDVRDVICRVDIDAYKKNRHIKFVRAELDAALKRTINLVEETNEKGLDAGDIKAAADVIRAKIDLLDKDPAAYLAKYEPKDEE